MKKETIIGIIFVAIAYVGCSLLPKEKPATTQDINCRALARDGANAKTQAEYDYAKQKFGEQCNGWTDPRK